MDSTPGTYALLLQSNTNTAAQIGRWGELDICQGYYVYVGSAFGPGGVLARVSRHCRIDYLRDFTCLTSVWYSHSPTRLEHIWAQAMAKMRQMTPIQGFGCSDCNCEAHLFFATKEPKLATFARNVGSSVKSWSCERID